jgi:hypothetical protein
MIYAYAQSHPTLAAKVKQRHKFLADFLDFVGIFGICIFNFAERATGVNKVAGIYAHFLDVQSSLECSRRIEVYVCHQRHLAAVSTHHAADFAKIAGVVHALRGEAHNVSAGSGNALNLRGTGGGIERGRIGHRLQAYGVVTANGSVANAHSMTFTTQKSHNP